MTWANLVDVHLNNLAGKRSSGGDIKLPSRGTQGDVRTAFGIDNKTKLFDPKKRPCLAVLQDMKITDLAEIKEVLERELAIAVVVSSPLKPDK
jgi:hypothetical protein